MSIIGKERIGWGILGCGGIARKFIQGLKEINNADIIAAGSRSVKRAEEFAAENGVLRAYGSYNELVSDPDVDVVYIASTHNHHYEHILLCLKNDKHVLCEKPMCLNSVQVQECISLAESKGKFLMEAMWTRFLPIWIYLKPMIDSGVLGEISMVQADFGFYSSHGEDGRHLNPDLAGGALLDVGIYPISLATWIFGRLPTSSYSNALMTKSGVDGLSSYYLYFGDGKQALLSSSVIQNTRKEAVIVGEDGFIRIPDFWMGQSAEIHLNNQNVEVVNKPYSASGYQFEAMHVMECLQKKQQTSSVMPLQETLGITQLMDQFRKSWGLKYPGE